ncbi:hypothetical protein OCAR_4256 [Afipia carboxidovorans OM5]|nr:hypothetical protein OCAR_4256 [Afipia carboxidovorans OM5]
MAYLPAAHWMKQHGKGFSKKAFSRKNPGHRDVFSEKQPLPAEG